ncbi:hypothetical protein U2E72_13210 [Acinetobacter baumannii]|uniref:hypothetical protein n=1 Tax=Acinetobacter calcoaceticus/baumannii complex TaxID=909768 RepID=UPI000892C2BB|nr:MULTISPECIES: hypothetical protein [Acinetobacter calcoaceticus/baumannii complex]EKV1658204.1 hypothetical protein [Acinetobacter baumannii]EKV1847115.1 hypothetical protein [Acinetobacter baumannii]EKV4645658.1 hypothetical protein [Acinetobacter baumannii]MBF6833665.1 hypothetical protein [Acinetobacter baumannii]MCE6085931.1 hypothetical protein [Acinetobacter baumannii]
MLEQFARLNAGTQSLVVSNKVPLLDTADLCGVLASLEDHHSWYVYAMIDQRRSYNMELLHTYLMQLLLQEMLLRRFYPKKVKPSEFAYGVTKAVIYAHFHPKGKCKACNGFGVVGAKPCVKCDGKGTKEHNWSERLEYGFPMHKGLTRSWYRIVCQPYDRFLESKLAEIQNDLHEKLLKLKKIEKAYRREENESLFDGI